MAVPSSKAMGELQLTLERHECGMEYFLFTPTAPPLAVICALHGSGGVSNKDNILNQGLIKRLQVDIEFSGSFPFLLVQPIAKQKNWERQADAVMNVISKFSEGKKVFLIGESMGGHGVMRLATLFPGQFAGVIPICGYLDRSNKGKLKEAGNEIAEAIKSLSDTPMWFFHSADDAIVSVLFSDHIVEQLRKAGNIETIRYTRYDTAPGLVIRNKTFSGHGAHELVFVDPTVFDWLKSLL